MAKIIILLAAGIVLCTALPVDKQPLMADAPVEVLFRDAQPVTLNCYTEGNKQVKYSWVKNGQPFNWQQHKDIIQRKDEGTLTFNKPQPTDEGQYQCFAESDVGIASSRVISLKRTYIEVPKLRSEDHSAVEGKPYSLKCQIPEGYPKPTIQWKKQDGSKPSVNFLNRRILAAPDGNLYFSNVTQEDVSSTEKYLCVALSPAVDGEVPIIEHYIKTLDKDSNPTDQGLFEQYVSKDMTAKRGNVTMIYCIYGGTPLAHPDWSKDGTSVNNEPSDRITRHNRSSGRRLLIKDTYLEDQGTYTCKVENGVGKPKTHSMYLTVVSDPTFTKKPEQQINANEGQDVTIPCQVSAVPAPKITWTHNAKPLSKNSRISVTADGLSIKKIEKSDKGYYGCRAENSVSDIYAETLIVV